MARDRPPPERATIQDVALNAGVSRGTVSRVLNNERYVSARAKTSVQAAVVKVGYVRNAAARNLVTKRSGAVALIVHEPHSLVLDDPNIGNILIGTNTVLSEADHQMVTLIVDSQRDTDRVVEYLRGGFVDGAVILSSRIGDSISAAVSQLRLPAAIVGSPNDVPEIPCIGIDNKAAAETIVRRLLLTGRNRVGMLASGLDRDSGRDRLAGFIDALGDRFDPALVVRHPFYSYQAGVEGMTHLLQLAPDIDGIFASSDAVAAGAMDVLHRSGRRVPEDIGVVGFDDSSWALRCFPSLSTIRQPAEALGRHAAELVLSQLANTDTMTVGMLLPTEVIWRMSA